MAITNLRIKVGERWYTVRVGDLDHSPVEVTVEGETYHVEVEGLPAEPPTQPRPSRPNRSDTLAPPSASRTGPITSSDNVLRSPMPGRVIAILVRPGDRVSMGDELCVVEAMKMEQSIRAPRDGVVGTIHVQPMDSVHANDPLIELE